MRFADGSSAPLLSSERLEIARKVARRTCGRLLVYRYTEFIICAVAKEKKFSSGKSVPQSGSVGGGGRRGFVGEGVGYIVVYRYPKL